MRMFSLSIKHLWGRASMDQQRQTQSVKRSTVGREESNSIRKRELMIRFGVPSPFRLIYLLQLMQKLAIAWITGIWFCFMQTSFYCFVSSDVVRLQIPVFRSINPVVWGRGEFQDNMVSCYLQGHYRVVSACPTRFGKVNYGFPHEDLMGLRKCIFSVMAPALWKALPLSPKDTGPLEGCEDLLVVLPPAFGGRLLVTGTMPWMYFIIVFWDV